MRDSPEASIHMFEGTHENPELIWNEDTKKMVSRAVRRLTAGYIFSVQFVEFNRC